MQRLHALVMFVAVLGSACSLKTSMTGSGPSSPGPAAGGAAASPDGGGSGTSSSSSGGGSDRVAMPNLDGMTVGEANAALRAAGIRTEVEVNRKALECEGAARVPGRINCQTPQAGELVYQSAIIGVTVHEDRGHAGRIVRDQLVKAHGMAVADAKAYLKSIGHTGPVVVFEQHTFNDACGVGKVCSAEPGSGVPEDGQITLVINKSSLDIKMPD